MLDQLIEVLSPAADGELNFIGSHMHPNGSRVYGGQVLGQVARAAIDTVDERRTLHSQHAYFLRPGKTDQPIRLEVENARDGASFSSRRVVALQDNKPILVSTLSFQIPAKGDDFAPEAPAVAAPESLQSEREINIAGGTIDRDFMIVDGEDLDVRVVEPIDWLNPVVRPAVLHAWMKTNGPLPDNPALHQAVLAYMSDIFPIDVCMFPHGNSFKDPNLQSASLDHALWVHGEVRADEWLLNVTEVDSIGGGRGLSRGHFFTREGRLVATTMQQSLIRWRKPPSI